MPQKSLYAKMRLIQKRTGACYRHLADLTEHDRATIKSANPGDMFWWIPYHLGTHLFPVDDTRPRIELQRGGDRFETVSLAYCVKQFCADGLRYAFHLTVGQDGDGHVRAYDLEKERFVLGGVDLFDKIMSSGLRYHVLNRNKKVLKAKALENGRRERLEGNLASALKQEAFGNSTILRECPFGDAFLTEWEGSLEANLFPLYLECEEEYNDELAEQAEGAEGLFLV